AAVGPRRLARAAARITACTLERAQHAAVEILAEPLRENAVGVDIVCQGLERGRIDVEFEAAIAAGEQHPRRAWPQLMPRRVVTQARTESPRNHDQRRLVERRLRRPVQRAARWPVEASAGTEAKPGSDERTACPAIHAWHLSLEPISKSFEVNDTGRIAVCYAYRTNSGSGSGSIFRRSTI